ncbi:FeoB-associated Cys-rich membrane protein [Desulfovibrio mangrovi]|uniref:FeoB-associated Cys-rich membrane protein n=1 Tax=Desulfovibrio mangrovi TaxID=2976983 RepID=UPI002247F0DE|nr:FeoB-associated Cys-rich membrane protein [Desulfovibrio mangrovi]UZP69011.1 FeoB-associated Cys-rich membrane protein [Desulfovibrio mangrovi]
MWDTLAVALIVVAAAAYLIRRQLTKKPSDGCGCSGGCGGCGSARHIRSDEREIKPVNHSCGCGGSCGGQ